jgi:hypothetical protein
VGMGSRHARPERGQTMTLSNESIVNDEARNETPLKARLIALRVELEHIYERYGSKALIATAQPAAALHGVSRKSHIAYVVYCLGVCMQDNTVAASAISSYAATALPIYPLNPISPEERCAFIAATIAIELGERGPYFDLESVEEDALANDEVFFSFDLGESLLDEERFDEEAGA